MSGLRHGQVVRRINPRYGTAERGVVAECAGDPPSLFGHRMYLDDYAIEMSEGFGCWIAGGGGTWAEEWETVPEGEQTAQERVRAVIHGWRSPDWVEPGDEPQAFDTWPWALVVAAVGPEFAAIIAPEGGDWAGSWHELATALADYLDRKRELHQ